MKEIYSSDQQCLRLRNTGARILARKSLFDVFSGAGFGVLEQIKRQCLPLRTSLGKGMRLNTRATSTFGNLNLEGWLPPLGYFSARARRASLEGT